MLYMLIRKFDRVLKKLLCFSTLVASRISKFVARGFELRVKKWRKATANRSFTQHSDQAPQVEHTALSCSASAYMTAPSTLSNLNVDIAQALRYYVLKLSSCNARLQV